MTNDHRSPEELRTMFSANLRQLCQQYSSVSELCRRLGINRTQFNRYLGGESFPRPDVLDRICRFFDVDARILLRPLKDIKGTVPHPAAGKLNDFLGNDIGRVTETQLPAGFYLSTESALDNPEDTCRRIYHVRRLPSFTVVRGFDPHKALIGEPAFAREVQGFAARAGQQIYFLMSRRNAEQSRMYLISRRPAEDTDPWRGFSIGLSQPVVETTAARRVRLRHLGREPSAILSTARSISNQRAAMERI